MMWGNGYGMGWGWLFGGLILVGLIVLIVVVVLVVIRSGSAGRTVPNTPGTAGASRTPREILDERYARGELTTDEYRERVQAIRSDS